jgi:hypothetical protein
VKLEQLTMEKLIEYHRVTKESASLGDLRMEITRRLAILRQHAAGHREMSEALDGDALPFSQLLDQIMEAMDAAGVADANHRSIEDAENEPNRTRAYDLRAMLEERFELLQAHNARSAQIMDGRV